jgi:hypothetical protein
MKAAVYMHFAVLCALLAPATVHGANSPGPSPLPSPTVSPPPMPVFAYASPPAREQEVPADAVFGANVTALLDASDYASAIDVLKAYVDDPSRTDADAMDLAEVRQAEALSSLTIFPQSVSADELG